MNIINEYDIFLMIDYFCNIIEIVKYLIWFRGAHKFIY